jgi:hypothetical protein
MSEGLHEDFVASLYFLLRLLLYLLFGVLLDFLSFCLFLGLLYACGFFFFASSHCSVAPVVSQGAFAMMGSK